MIDDKKMKTSRALLSGMLITLMMPAFADDTEGSHRGQNKREGSVKQSISTTTATMTQMAQPPVVMRRSLNSFIGFKHTPTVVPNVSAPSNAPSNVQRNPQPQIKNEPVGRSSLSGTVLTERFQSANQSFDSNQNHRHYDVHNDRNLVAIGGIGRDGYVRTNDPNLTNRGYIRSDNSNFSSDGYIRTQQNRNINDGNSRVRYIRDRDYQGWRGDDRVTQYRMPYRQGYSDRYRVYYTQSWPGDYGWRSHGWSMNYREADPYWFAVITSIALAQAWSDAEVAQAINDDHLRQQLIYDEDIRQQMIASGYPANQMDYSPDDYGNPYDLNTTYPPQNQTVYYPPPVSPNQNSPLYSGVPLASGDQVANRNANQNVLFFCNAGNKQYTVETLRLIQSPDMSVWKTMESYNKCRLWAVSP